MAASPTLVRSPARAVESIPAAEGTRLLYERYYDRIFGYCLYQLGSREEAEDAAQTTFLWAFRGLRRGVIPRAEDSWLFTIAKNACRARHRTRGRNRRREVTSDPQVLADISPAPSGEHEELIGLEDALARMPELQRRAILLREWRGLSYREIATELDISGAAVETLIFRARRSLAELLNGKAAPKRARRFAFDVGSIGAALKTAFGGASAAKLGAGVATALVLATGLGGAVERSAPRPTSPAPVAVPSLPADAATPKAGRASNEQKADRRGAEKKQKPAREARPPAAPTTPADDAPAANGSIGGSVEETIRSLPLGSQVNETLPVGAVTDAVDTAVDKVEQTVDDVPDVLP